MTALDPQTRSDHRSGTAHPAVSIVIPCYRDAEQMSTIFARMGPVMDEVEGGAELILVDDGSPDDTSGQALAGLEQFGRQATVVRLARNFGQHPAVYAGLAQARGSVVVTLDSDLQYPPEQIQFLLDEKQRTGADVVSGIRAERKDPFVRRLLTRVIGKWLGRRTGQQLQDYGSMFRAYDRRVVDMMLQVTEQHRFIPAVVAWLGVSIHEVPVQHEARGEQGSRYRLGPLVDMLLDLLTSYSVSPLRVVTTVSAGFAVLGFTGSASFAVYRIIVGEGISGTVSAFALVFLLLAVQLVVLAMLSEYMGRIYAETKARPYYLVADVTRHQP